MDIPTHLATMAIDGARFSFDVVFGRVANQHKWSETRVWGGGGGGHVGRRGGTLAPVQIHSAVDLNQEIWLELPDGSPYCLQLRNLNAQVLDGHPVSAVLVQTGTSGNSWVALVSNLATGAVFEDCDLARYLARTYAPSSVSAVLLKLAAVLVSLGIMWSGFYLLGFILLFPALALAGRIGRSMVEDKGRSIRQHARRVHYWLVEELDQKAKAAQATVIEGAIVPVPQQR